MATFRPSHMVTCSTNRQMSGSARQCQWANRPTDPGIPWHQQVPSTGQLANGPQSIPPGSSPRRGTALGWGGAPDTLPDGIDCVAPGAHTFPPQPPVRGWPWNHANRPKKASRPSVLAPEGPRPPGPLIVLVSSRQRGPGPVSGFAFIIEKTVSETQPAGATPLAPAQPDNYNHGVYLWRR